MHRWSVNGVISARRMTAVGFTRGEIRSLQRRELIFPAHEGIFFLDAHPTRLAEWTAAVARCGPPALLSHFSAAALWRIVIRDYGWPEVLRPRGARDIPRIHVRTSSRPAEPAKVSGVPVTTLTRTIEDCAAAMTPPAIKRMLRQAEHHHALDLSLLDGTRCRRLREVLRLYVPGQGKTDSELEAAFFELSHRAGLPTPTLQRPTPGGRADFVYEELRLIVEVDGYGAHRGRVAFREDRARDRANLARGYVTMRFTWEDVTETPDDVMEDLRQACRPRSNGR